MDTPANVPNPTIVSGSVLLAHLFNWGLFGVLSVQVYLYYVAFPHDPRGLKSVVAAIFLLELIQTILLTHDAFRVYASGWGNTADLDSMGLYWFSIPVLGGLISALTQLFYAWRIHMLSGSYWAAGVISVVAVAQGVNEIYDGVLCLKTGSFSQLPNSKAFEMFIVYMAMCCFCDVMIASCMTFHFQRAKKAILGRETSNLLTRVIALTIETGLLCCAGHLAALICFVVADQTLLYTMFISVTSKLYSNSLLAILNSRIQILSNRDDGGDATTTSNSIQFRAINSTSASLSQTQLRFQSSWREANNSILAQMSLTSDRPDIDSKDTNHIPKVASRAILSYHTGTSVNQ